MKITEILVRSIVVNIVGKYRRNRENYLKMEYQME